MRPDKEECSLDEKEDKQHQNDLMPVPCVSEDTEPNCPHCGERKIHLLCSFVRLKLSCPLPNTAKHVLL